MSQFNRNQESSQEPGRQPASPLITSFSNGEPSRLVSPLSTYSPNSFFLQRERSNSPPQSTRELLNAFPSPRISSPGQAFLSPSQPSSTLRNYHNETAPLNVVSASPAGSYLNRYSPISVDNPPATFPPNTGLGMAGTTYGEPDLSPSEQQEDMLDYLQSPQENSRNSHRFTAQDIDNFYQSGLHSPGRNSEYSGQRDRSESQDFDHVKRLSMMPPPEPIEIPTAEDVRFGIKGAKSAGWTEVRRQSMLRQTSNNSNSSNQGWRQSFFGKFGSSDDVSKYAEIPEPMDNGRSKDTLEELQDFPARKESSLSIMVEQPNLARSHDTTFVMNVDHDLANPSASFMRPISMAGDQNLQMMRGDRLDPNPTAMRFCPPLNNSESLSSVRGSTASVLSGNDSGLYNRFGHSRMTEDLSIRDKEDEKRLGYLPHNLDVFDFREAEVDDALHDPGPVLPRKGVDRMIVESKAVSGETDWLSVRGWLNAIGLGILAITLVSLFAGFPIIDYFIKHPIGTLGGFNLGGINATGQVPQILGFRGLIDADTPRSARTKKGTDGKDYQLVFSDEFNQDNRTFWPGDDPYWEAVDLHYWATSNLEWYDPDQITTRNGSLVISLDKVADPSMNHNLDFKGGMLQSWNKFCFTGGIIEASISLPGDPKAGGFWPAFWTMGNLGRAGYGASLDGTWPYSYDSCDIGTLPNQTDPKTGGPIAAQTMGDPYHDNVLSYLPGQRFSRCTCPKASGKNYHPGPKHPDGTWVGRSAPEIDILEAITDPKTKLGQISQSVQLAPYNANYRMNNRTQGYVKVADNSFETVMNPYTGNIYQQAASGLSNTDQTSYDGKGYASYGFEYATSDSANPFITWTQKDQTMWQLTPGAIGPDPLSQIGPRVIPNEPMYILLNLGISATFGAVDLKKLGLPAKMRVDWVRVYQPAGTPINTNCSPSNYPTAQYIQDHQAAYMNPNLTTWVQYQQAHGDNTGNAKTGFPKNKLLDTC
ncbi:hypothetical protein PTTG_04502 [Puccinia triticina 1-1 BBBD Race 1]|uniref:GH16 domain-containing protein n=1 Tax=Puccinia triticina (isolate 1-1 / race 1 (BBBD)) TaxID=630390 RepID=A0A180H450_PUCT1|nr:hypothetical protein PTTG_04502 [Puccinia triticina 1-1 BBBD Race 1]WAR57675.1 hypothetical protein PtB15_8B728 [Puccinia triticina]